MLKEELRKEVMELRGVFELPCFTEATKIWLSLGFLGLVLPPWGVFAALRELYVEYVRFHGEFTLDDAMLPFLEGLEIRRTCGLTSLMIRLKTLIRMTLFGVQGLLRLNTVVPGLKKLEVVSSFRVDPQAVCIAAAELVELDWLDRYCPTLVNFNQDEFNPSCERLSLTLFPYGRRQDEFNPSCERLLKHFSLIDYLNLLVMFESLGHGDSVPLMQGITKLSDITTLQLELKTEGHAYGAIVMHILTMCTGIERLTLRILSEPKLHNACPLNCTCDRPPNWRAKDISMEFLREVHILNFRGKDHELDLLRLLVSVAPALVWIKITCHRSFTVWETLSKDGQSFASREICVDVSQVTRGRLQPQ